MIKVNKSVILLVALYGCETGTSVQEKITCWGHLENRLPVRTIWP